MSCPQIWSSIMEVAEPFLPKVEETLCSFTEEITPDKMGAALNAFSEGIEPDELAHHIAIHKAHEAHDKFMEWESTKKRPHVHINLPHNKKKGKNTNKDFNIQPNNNIYTKFIQRNSNGQFV